MLMDVVCKILVFNLSGQLLHNVGVGLELATPLFPFLFVPLASLANTMKVLRVDVEGPIVFLKCFCRQLRGWRMARQESLFSDPFPNHTISEILQQRAKRKYVLVYGGATRSGG